MQSKTVIAVAFIASLAWSPAGAKELNSVGMSMGSLSNPYFNTMVDGAREEAKKINPNAKLIVVSSEYDLGKQSDQILNFIASKVDLILVAAADPRALGPAIQRARAAGITVVAIDVEAEGAEATIETDNVKAGEISCEYLAKKLDGTGQVAIQWAGPTSSSIARVKGCKEALAKHPDIKVLDDIRDTKCQRDLGLSVMKAQLLRYPDLKGMFAICEPAAIGANLAAQQLKRDNLVITSVDGSPDAVEALKSNTLLAGTASQDPRLQGALGIETGVKLMNGGQPEEKLRMLQPELVTRENVGQYKGW